jgi:hypothetical protein
MIRSHSIPSVVKMPAEGFRFGAITARVRDKAMSQPFLGRGTVSFSPSLHGGLKSRAAAAG